MNLVGALEIAAWVAKAIKAIVDIGTEAMKASDTVSLEQLKEKVKAILDERHEDWTKEIREEADKALIEEAKKAAEDPQP